MKTNQRKKKPRGRLFDSKGTGNGGRLSIREVFFGCPSKHTSMFLLLPNWANLSNAHQLKNVLVLFLITISLPPNLVTHWCDGQCTGLRVERPGFETWPGQCVVFLGKTIYSDSAPLKATLNLEPVLLCVPHLHCESDLKKLFTILITLLRPTLNTDGHGNTKKSN